MTIMKKINSLLFMAIAAGSILVACEKTETEPGDQDQGTMNGYGVIVANEGNFGWGNASLSYYDKVNDTIYHDLFYKANGENLGDVFQSVTVFNDLAYLVINNSGKIEVVDPQSFERKGLIEGLVSPRYMLPVSETKAYVSDLFGSHLVIVDLESHEITGEIAMNGWTESMIRAGDRVLATGVQSGYVYEIDPQTDKLTDSIYLPPGPISMAKDAGENIWVLAGGAPFFKSHPALYRIETNNLKISGKYLLPNPDMMYSNLVTCPDGETLYFLGGGVYTMSATVNEPQVELLIPSNGSFYYALAVDPDNGDIYVSDPIDFVQEGKILRYNNMGVLQGTTQAGIIPGYFSFY